MGSDQLQRVPGISVSPAADDVGLAVAEALLPGPLPDALMHFLRLSDGARVGDLQIFGTEGLIDAASDDSHRWQQPGTVVIGFAEPGRALIMHGARDEVYEIDSDTWDEWTMRIAADTPLDLFIRHFGLPLSARHDWWAFPALGTAIDETRLSHRRDVDALLEKGIGVRAGKPLPPSLSAVRQVEIAGAALLSSPQDLDDYLLNYRPAPPVAGPSARSQWSHLCDEILESRVRDQLRSAELSGSIPGLEHLDDAGETTIAETIRSHAFLSLIAKARDELARRAGGPIEQQSSPASLLADVFLAGHIPVSLTSAI